MPDQEIHVIKLGGSLLDLHDLPQRWMRFADAWLRGCPLVVVGGGQAADTVRSFDQRFNLDETAGHWLAVHAMAFNARLVAAVLPGAEFVNAFDAARAAWQHDHIAVIDPVAWLTEAESSGNGVPHEWIFTSDSIAAHLASTLNAKQLTLLKSTLPTGDCDPDAAAELGIVDASFPRASAGVPSIDLINLRHEPVSAEAARCVLR